jgi:hypothetical protein
VLRLAPVGRGCDRDVGVLEIVARADERQCLERLRRRAKRGEEARVAELRDRRAVVNGDRMHGMDRLDEGAASHGYADRVHERGP